uniref:Uncharacterized protein n=1 Tax=Schistocephalus solidus TaxID=70667 RepID=A0A0X3NJM1_SCHSO
MTKPRGRKVFVWWCKEEEEEEEDRQSTRRLVRPWRPDYTTPPSGQIPPHAPPTIRDSTTAAATTAPMPPPSPLPRCHKHPHSRHHNRDERVAPVPGSTMASTLAGSHHRLHFSTGPWAMWTCTDV